MDNSHTGLAYIGMSNGDGTFSFQSLFWSPGYDTVESGDLNGDGKTDFVLYNSATGTLYSAISNGSGGFCLQVPPGQPRLHVGAARRFHRRWKSGCDHIVLYNSTTYTYSPWGPGKLLAR